MWIKIENENVSKIFRRNFMEEPVEFSSNGKAQVSKEVGEKLIELYPSIHKVETTSSQTATDYTKEESEVS